MARITTTKKPKTRMARIRERATKPSPWPSYDFEPRFDPDELRKQLRIDKYSLDTEVERQPETYGEVADAAVKAKSQVESLEEQLKELESNIDTLTRKELSGERTTENEIKAIIANDKQRKEMVKTILSAKHLQRQLEALQTSFRHRSYALRDMVDLYLSSYYSSRSAKGAREDHKEVEAEQISDKMKVRRTERTEKRVKRHRQRPQ